MNPTSDKKIFFYCQEQGSPDKAAFQHPIIVLAEGLKKLGVLFYSDKNYWRISPDTSEHLFSHDPQIGPADCDVVVVNSTWMHYAGALPEGLFRAGRKYLTVYIDDDDGLYTRSATPLFRNFDVILRAQYNKKHLYPKNIVPWQFGFSERIVKALGEPIPYDRRTGGTLCNFRVMHSVRQRIKDEFMPGFEKLFPIDSRTDAGPSPAMSPLDSMLWEQTGKRHYPDYFSRLKEARACFAFGGYFSAPFPRSVTNPLLRKMHALVSGLNLKTDTVIQFDSWRFWESLVAGCVTFHVDFAKYGCVLPVMPENWKHYVGIDLDDIEGSLAAVEKNLPRFPEISRAGREWALANYGPKAVAGRFMEIVSRPHVTI